MELPPPVAPRCPALTTLVILAVLYTLYLAAELILPILVATLLTLVLTPVVVRLKRLGLPRGLAAGLVTVVVVGVVAGAVEMLASPAIEWLDRAPESLGEIERKILPVRKPVEQVMQATEKVEQIAGGGQSRRSVVTVKSFDLGQVFVVSVTTLAVQTVVVVVLLFFLLATGDRLLRRTARLPRSIERRRRIVAIARGVKQDVSVYLGLITLINLGLGVVTGLVMWALGMPNPALWGALVGLLNYIPYAGALTTLLVVLVVGLLSFDDLWRGVLPAIAVLGLHMLESDVVTPWIVGRRLTLPPLMVFLFLTIWGWMWGVVGALLAVPLLVIFKVAADHVPVLAPWAAFLNGHDRRPGLKPRPSPPKLAAARGKAER